VRVAKEARSPGFAYEDELLFGSWFNIADKLKSQAKIATAAQVLCDAASRKQAGLEERCKCAGARRRRAALAGTWLAPQLAAQEGGACKHRGVCPACSAALAEGGAGKVKCECCEEAFHVGCLGLDPDLVLDFVCSRCVGFQPPKRAVAEAGHDAADEEE
jgi:hypothetical protein